MIIISHLYYRTYVSPFKIVKFHRVYKPDEFGHVRVLGVQPTIRELVGQDIHHQNIHLKPLIQIEVHVLFM